MKLEINKVIKILILSDLALMIGLGLVTPIFAIFLTQNIKGGNVEVAGFAAAIYWIVKSLVIIPFGRFLDRNFGEKDDLLFVVFGNLMAALSIFGYIFSKMPWHIYCLQAIYAIGMGMNIPGYLAIFTRHIDKGKEALEWSMRSSVIGIGTGTAGALGGVLVARFGFIPVFCGVGAFILISAFLPILLWKYVLAKKKGEAQIPETKEIHPPKE